MICIRLLLALALVWTTACSSTQAAIVSFEPADFGKKHITELTFDASGLTLVNVIPEPSSMAALCLLSGLILARRSRS